jgi:hypothetical protein
MGGNGEYIPYAGLALLPPAGSGNPIIYLEPGLGGGCVEVGSNVISCLVHCQKDELLRDIFKATGR